MRTILFANELGQGFGHINRLLAVAAHFKGYRRVFAVADRALAMPAIEAVLGVDVEVMTVAEWRWGNPARLPSEPFWTLADMLFDQGFGEHKMVAGAIRLWRDQLAHVRPDLIVADFAPMLRAASAGQISTVMVGSGYTIPPAVSPLPGMDWRDRAVPPRSAAHELTILQTVNDLREQLGDPPLKALFELFRADPNFSTTFGFADTYRGIRSEPLFQPFNLPRIPVGPDFSERRGPDVFCYLDASHSAVNAVLTALNGLARPSQVFIRGIDPLDLAPHCASQVGIHQNQADFRTLLPQTRLLIHAGGLGTSTAGLMTGVPQLLLPTYLDQEHMMSGMEPFGCSIGARLDGTAEPREVRSLIETLLDSPAVQRAALTTARTLQMGLVDKPETIVVAACLKLL